MRIGSNFCFSVFPFFSFFFPFPKRSEFLIPNHETSNFLYPRIFRNNAVSISPPRKFLNTFEAFPSRSPSLWLLRPFAFSATDAIIDLPLPRMKTRVRRFSSRSWSSPSEYLHPPTLWAQFTRARPIKYTGNDVIERFQTVIIFRVRWRS